MIGTKLSDLYSTMVISPMASERLGSNIAIVAITKEAGKLAVQLEKTLDNSKVYLSRSAYSHLSHRTTKSHPFHRLAPLLSSLWQSCDVIVCIMATGIVVRTIAPLIGKKHTDPAVIVLDEKGQFVISLLSGHIGGANYWTKRIAELLGATPVITTASDLRGKIALDIMARDRGLVVEPSDNASSSLAVTMRRLLDGEPMWIFDPEELIAPELRRDYPSLVTIRDIDECYAELQGIWVSETLPPEDLNCLRLHPKNLLVGVGCNRGTPEEEILFLIEWVFQRERLFLGSIQALVSIEIKREEDGLRQAAERLGVPLLFVSRDSLNAISVPNPSLTVQKHIGVKGVCEAAPIALNPLARLIIPKNKSQNATIAVARVPFRL
ncbi:MAG: cobalamin biosynthesis protein [Syntrophobacterales bacterium]|nr:cobalamin biosynthesis protein [Syntrophobacterales bacterium]